MKYIGCDPSYTAYGLSIINTDKNKILLTEFSVPYDKHSHVKILNAISELTSLVVDWTFKNATPIGLSTTVGIELATTYGQFSQAELYALDYSTYNYFKNKINVPTYLYPTTYTHYIKNNKKPLLGKKEDTIFLVEEILSIFRSYDYEISFDKTEDTICSLEKVKNKYPRTKTITSGEADSFLFALNLFILDNTDSEIVKAILSKYPKLGEVKTLK